MIEVKDYIEMVSESIPYETKWGASIGEINIFCPQCNSKTVNNKYRFNEFNNSLDVIAVGTCTECSLIITAKPFRFYSDGRAMWKSESGEWFENKSSFFETMITKFKRIFSR